MPVGIAMVTTDYLLMATGQTSYRVYSGVAPTCVEMQNAVYILLTISIIKVYTAIVDYSMFTVR